MRNSKLCWFCGKPESLCPVRISMNGSRAKKTGRSSTVLNLLARLVERGFVAVERQGQGKMNIYSAAVGEQEYLEFESKTMLEKLYGNSVKNLVASLYNGKAMDDHDMKELQTFIDEHRKRGKDA